MKNKKTSFGFLIPLEICKILKLFHYSIIKSFILSSDAEYYTVEMVFFEDDEYQKREEERKQHVERVELFKSGIINSSIKDKTLNMQVQEAWKKFLEDNLETENKYLKEDMPKNAKAIIRKYLEKRGNK